MFDINDFMGYANAKPATSKPRKISVPNVRAMPKVETFVSSFKSAPLAVAVPVAKVMPVSPSVVVPVVKPAPLPDNIALELVHYSDRSFAIFGDTKPMAAKLDTLGGKFNRWLKRDGVPTPGYIFSIHRIDNVRKALNL